MKTINTKFGTIYIEELEYDRHCPAKREEEDRIKIFDSNKNYMDYWSMELLYDQSETYEQTLERVYQSIIHRYEQADNLDAICPDIRFSTNDVVKFALFMKVDEYLDIEDQDLITMIFHNPDKLEELVIKHEWVNKIGNTYLLIENY